MIDVRFKQAHREALYAVILTFLYAFLWLISAYFLPQTKGLLGFPVWFEMACFVTPVFFILLTFLMIKFAFKLIPLDSGDS